MQAAGDPGFRPEGVEQLSFVARGGFSTVYRGYQPTFGRWVAVKVVHALGEDESARARFEREQLSMGRLSQHPNVVTLYSSGLTPAGEPYLVMDYISGGSLAQRLASTGPMAPTDAARFSAGIAAALSSAHQLGIVHGDLKPGNVLVGTDRQALLTDFGIAQLVDRSGATGNYLTPGYAAPEQLWHAQAVPASDVWSLGVTLFALLTGQTPPAPSPDAPTDPARDSGARAVEVLRGAAVPAALVDVVAQCLQREAVARPDAMTVHRALSAAAAGAVTGISAVTAPSGAEAGLPPGSAAGAALAATTDPQYRVATGPGAEPVPLVVPAAGRHAPRSRSLVTLVAGGVAVIVLAVAGAAGALMVMGEGRTEGASSPATELDTSGSAGSSSSSGAAGSASSASTVAAPPTSAAPATTAAPQTAVPSPSTAGPAPTAPEPVGSCPMSADEMYTTVARSANVVGVYPTADATATICRSDDGRYYYHGASKEGTILLDAAPAGAGYRAVNGEVVFTVSSQELVISENGVPFFRQAVIGSGGAPPPTVGGETCARSATTAVTVPPVGSVVIRTYYTENYVVRICRTPDGAFVYHGAERAGSGSALVGAVRDGGGYRATNGNVTYLIDDARLEVRIGGSTTTLEAVIG